MTEISYQQNMRNRKDKNLDKINNSDKYEGNLQFTILGQI